MSDFSIGIILDSFRKPIPEALSIARQLGAQGVQVYATCGDMAPENLTGQRRRDFCSWSRIRGCASPPCAAILGAGLAIRS